MYLTIRGKLICISEIREAYVEIWNNGSQIVISYKGVQGYSTITYGKREECIKDYELLCNACIAIKGV